MTLSYFHFDIEQIQVQSREFQDPFSFYSTVESVNRLINQRHSAGLLLQFMVVVIVQYETGEDVAIYNTRPYPLQ